MNDNERLYGVDVREWLERWDAGTNVWSVELGGQGLGYEQAIQITVAELLRIVLDTNRDSSKWAEKDSGSWKKDRPEIEVLALDNDVIKNLGSSGAQFGAAMGMAARLHIYGPTKLFVEADNDRLIQVNREWPQSVGPLSSILDDDN